jgi:peptidoglycan/xylan/chitin deacetylase (PgdA/CDA1 family)
VFPKPSYDLNHDDSLSVAERARLQKEVPLTILLTVDDNGQPQGLTWILETFVKYGVWGKATFFITGNYAEGRPAHVGGPITQWWSSLSDENFVGIHGQTHDDGAGWPVGKWLAEHNATMAEITQRVKAPAGWAWDNYAWGSRAPYLSFTDAYFAALEQVSPRVLYDASMIVHPTATPAKADDPRDLSWPFSLTEGVIPADVELPFSEAQQRRVTIGRHKILVVPVYSWVIKKKNGSMNWVPSLDVNLFKEYGCSGDAPNRELIDSFEANLVAHYKGNRAPFHLGLHAQNYTLDRKCERATMDALLLRIQQYAGAGWDLRYESMPRLLEWMATD